MFFPQTSAFAAFAEVFYGARRIHDGARADARRLPHRLLPRHALRRLRRRRPRSATRPSPYGGCLCEALADARACAPMQGGVLRRLGATVAHAVCPGVRFASQGVAAPYDVYAASPGAGVCAVDDLWIDLRRICPVKCGFCSQDQSMSCVAQAPPAPPTWSTHG